MMTKTKPGGPRPGAGRKPLEGENPTMKSVKLCSRHWDIAKKIGDGNRAEGIRRALDAYAAPAGGDHMDLDSLWHLVHRAKVFAIKAGLSDRGEDLTLSHEARMVARDLDDGRYSAALELFKELWRDREAGVTRAVQQEERERCAKIVEQGPDNGISYQALWRLAAAIRDAS